MDMCITLNLSSGRYLPATSSPSAILVSFMSQIRPQSLHFVSVAMTLLQAAIISRWSTADIIGLPFSTLAPLTILQTASRLIF